MELCIVTLEVFAKTWRLTLVLGMFAYLVLVHVLRYQRAKSLEKKHAPAGRESFRNMTADDAQAILKTLAELEFPSFYGVSMVMALFRTYGIPSISSLLVATGQLKNAETASKRAADAGVLLLEFGLNKPTSERAIEAIARMNFLHSRYQKSGKITNDDLLYALSIFALEPSRWINRYEWRCVSDVEMCAFGTYWKNMGDAMEISCAKLPSSMRGWRDGLHWLIELEEWSDEYEEANMVPADTNRQLADSQLDTLLPKCPATYLDSCRKMVIALLGDRLRRSMMYPQSPPIYHNTINAILSFRKLLIRHLALPRPNILRNHWIEAGPDRRNGRYVLSDYLAHPWYVKPTLRRRWGPGAWITRLLGYNVPGDDGDRYYPQGYTVADVGPKALSGKGRKEMDETRATLVSGNRGGCPFSRS